MLVKTWSSDIMFFDIWANVWNVCWPNVVSTLCLQHVLRWHKVAPTCWPNDGPTSKFTLGQLSLSKLGQRWPTKLLHWANDGQPNYSIGPTLSCYLGKSVQRSRYTDLALINGLWSTCSKIISLLCRTQANLALGIFCTFSCKKRKLELLRRLNFVHSKFSTSGYLIGICYVTA